MTFLSLAVGELRVVGPGATVSWAAPLAARQRMSAAGQRFSTWNTHSRPSGADGNLDGRRSSCSVLRMDWMSAVKD